jgi:probable HAF family extracellular repeat protein
MPSFPTIVHARRFRIVPAPSLVLGALLFAACQDSPVAPAATRPALAASLLQRAESRSERAFGFTTIDFPDAVSTSASGINARGDIVGSYKNGDGRTHGYLLRDGTFTTIDFTSSDGTAAAGTEAKGISPDGEVVGDYWMPGEANPVEVHGYRRTVQGEFVAVDYPRHTHTIIQRILPDGTMLGCRHDGDLRATMKGITISRQGYAEIEANWSMQNGATPDRRHIVGLYTNAAGSQQGFLIDDGVFKPLFVGEIPTTAAWDMNPAGEIIGVYTTSVGATTVYHGFVLRDEGYVSIDVPSATATRAFGINARGDVVGAYVTKDTKTHGFLASL